MDSPRYFTPYYAAPVRQNARTSTERPPLDERLRQNGRYLSAYERFVHQRESDWTRRRIEKGRVPLVLAPTLFPGSVLAVADVNFLGHLTACVLVESHERWWSSGLAWIDPWRAVYVMHGGRERELLLHELTHHALLTSGRPHNHRAGNPGGYVPTYSTEETCDFMAAYSDAIVEATDHVLAQWAFQRSPGGPSCCPLSDASLTPSLKGGPGADF